MRVFSRYRGYGLDRTGSAMSTKTLLPSAMQIAVNDPIFKTAIATDSAYLDQGYVGGGTGIALPPLTLWQKVQAQYRNTPLWLKLCIAAGVVLPLGFVSYRMLRK